MFRPILIALTLAAPTALFADTQLDRLEALSEEMNLGMAQLMAREIAANGGDPAPMLAAMPDTSWDAEYRAAGTCMLDGYTSLIGSDGVDAMLDNMEAMLPQMATATMESMAEMNPLPAGISQDQSIEITQSCGMMEIGMRRMQESGFTAAMMEAFSSTQGN